MSNSSNKTESNGEYLPPSDHYSLSPLATTGLFTGVGTALGLGVNRLGLESTLATSLPCLNGWGGPGVVFLATGLVNSFCALSVVQARIKYNVPWPALYAVTYPSDSEDTKTNNHKYNCVQRGHQHFLEVLPTFLAQIFVAGSKFPVLSTLTGLIAVAGRVAAFLGYASGDAHKKDQGSFGYIGYVLLSGLCYVSVAKHLKLID